MAKQYDRKYFDTWYRRRGIGDAARLARKVALAVATAEYHLERPIRTVLDVGCGEGAWRAPLLKLRPRARYLGFDSSEYAVRRFGARRNLHFARFGDFAMRSVASERAETCTSRDLATSPSCGRARRWTCWCAAT